MNSQDLEVRSLSAVEQANSLQVNDQPSYERACSLLCDVINPMIAEVDETFDPICDSAYRSWKTATDTRKRFKDPLLDGKKRIAEQIGAFELEQRRAIERAEREAREQQERLLAEMTEMAIEEAEACGASAEEVRAIIEQPIAAPRVAVTPTYTRVTSVTTRRTYKVEVADIRLLARAVADGKCATNLICPNESALNAMARAQGPELARFVPGIRVVEVSSVAGRKR